MVEISSNYAHFLMLKFSWYEYIVEEDSELKDSFNLITKYIWERQLIKGSVVNKRYPLQDAGTIIYCQPRKGNSK